MLPFVNDIGCHQNIEVAKNIVLSDARVLLNVYILYPEGVNDFVTDVIHN